MRERGFTLIELAVALALIGLIVALLSGGLRFGTGVVERLGAGAHEDARGAVAERALGRLLARALTSDLAPGGEGLTGDAAAARFLVRSDGPAGPDRIYRARLRDGADGLLLALCPWRAEASERHCEARPPFADALGALGGARLAYLDAAGRWRGAWRPRDGTPRAIRLAWRSGRTPLIAELMLAGAP